tara:strand:+ start:55 stop:588 length:534 start_codon:yes stop_codon:yes gene_type:complete
MSLVERARDFAIKAHKGQFRNTGKTIPLSTHLAEVAQLVTDHGGAEEEIAAAWLHDVVEDTSVTKEQILEEFGTEVYEIVSGLTDDPGLDELPVRESKPLQAAKIASEPYSVHLVKTGDSTSNVRSLITNPPLHWDSQTIINYTVGCGLVISQCRGVPVELQCMFWQAHHEVLMKYL